MIALLAAAALGAPELLGTWRIELSVRSVAEVPVVKTAESTTVTVGIVTVRADGDQLVHEQRACSVDIRDRNPIAKAALGDGVVDSLPATVAPISVDGGSYVVDLGTSYLGYAPVGGRSLPTEPTDPAVRDPDGDGRPGATVTVTIAGVGRFGMEVVQRSRAVLEGELVDGVVRGRVRTVDFAQGVLGADAPWLLDPPVVTHDDARSTFVMTPLPDGATCRDLTPR